MPNMGRLFPQGAGCRNLRRGLRAPWKPAVRRRISVKNATDPQHRISRLQGVRKIHSGAGSVSASGLGSTRRCSRFPLGSVFPAIALSGGSR